MFVKIIVLILIILFIPQAYFFLSDKKSKRHALEEIVNGEDFKFLCLDNLYIHGKIYKVPDPKAVVQIVHGALEHKERYMDLIKFLNKKGYSVVISDNRGHGESVNKKYPLGHINSLDQVIDDQLVINDYIKSHSDKDIYMIGHSMGSMIARNFLKNYDYRIKKLVLTGTVTYNPLVYFAIFVGNIINFYMGFYGNSKILKRLYSSGMSEGWLSFNEENLIEAKNDKLMLESFTNRGYLTVFHAMKELKNYKAYKLKNKDLKILSITGDCDIVVGGKKGLMDTIKTLKKIGYKNVSYFIMPHMKHEVLRENNKEDVFKIIEEFFNS